MTAPHCQEQIRLTDSQFERVKAHAEKADTGGRSNIDAHRQKGSQRQKEYQLVGQLCEAALYLYFEYPFNDYDQRRRKINRTPRKGDGGYDLIDAHGRRVDIKGSLARHDTLKISEYSLYIRQRERKGDRYILGIVQPHDWQLVHLVGWWPDRLLNSYPSYLQGDRYKIEGALLYPMLHYWEVHL